MIWQVLKWFQSHDSSVRQRVRLTYVIPQGRLSTDDLKYRRESYTPGARDFSIFKIELQVDWKTKDTLATRDRLMSRDRLANRAFRGELDTRGDMEPIH